MTFPLTLDRVKGLRADTDILELTHRRQHNVAADYTTTNQSAKSCTLQVYSPLKINTYAMISVILLSERSQLYSHKEIKQKIVERNYFLTSTQANFTYNLFHRRYSITFDEQLSWKEDTVDNDGECGERDYAPPLGHEDKIQGACCSPESRAPLSPISGVYPKAPGFKPHISHNDEFQIWECGTFLMFSSEYCLFFLSGH